MMPASTVRDVHSRFSPHPWLAVNFSMAFPGLGQFYVGERLWGVIVMVSELVLLAIASRSIFSATGNTVTGLVCILLAVIVYISNLFDAYIRATQYSRVRVSERIPRQHKDPWFAVFITRILPGLGHLYLERAFFGAFFLALIIIFSTLSRIIPHLLFLTPIISAIACYHIYTRFPQSRRFKQNWLVVIAGIVLVSGLIANYLPHWIQQKIEPFEIPSSSMFPTLQKGDKILVNKASHYSPQPKDLIVFREPEAIEKEPDFAQESHFVKRVIGKPGQVVRVANGIVYINDRPLAEPYLTEPPGYEWGPKLVPAESYFVLGDNRNDSLDSHVWGFLPERDIVGQAYKIYWPPERIQSLVISH
jgi:signal peptidase I